jgi:alanyl-tRNA synthetase
LADTSEQSLKYHTATHLLNAALKTVLGPHVEQKGSNITPERLRFDFAHSAKMTDDEKKRVEDLINEKIAEKLEVSFEEMPLEKAREIGATGVFGEKYADVVKVYSIGKKSADGKSGSYFSQEICGGPHVENTGVLGHFKIAKEEAVSAGVRRIKAVLE